MGSLRDELDFRMRQAAFDHVRELNLRREVLTSDDLAAGFPFQGDRIPLVNPQRGIFKPRQMHFALSIRTVYPRAGARVWYDDQLKVHERLYTSDEYVEYSFMGTDAHAADNRWLLEAHENRVPIIYFVGVAPGRYIAALPCYIATWDASRLCVHVAFGDPMQFTTGYADNAPARRYALRAVQQRLHQSSFREAVIAAYGERCALSGLPGRELLDAAHIIDDKHELLGQPTIRNGLPLSKLHHAAFDAHLLGVDPDYRIHVAPRLRDQTDGPTLEALKALEGARLRLPIRPGDQPDRDRLALRFDQFRARF